MSKGTLFTRLPAWLREALGAVEPDVPNQLGGIIDPVVDIGQGGWGTADWLLSQVSAANNTNIVDVFASDRDLQTVILGVDVDNSGSAVPSTVTVSALSLTGQECRLWRRTVAAGLVTPYNTEDSGSVTRMGMPRIVVPSAFGVRVTVACIGAGSSCTATLLLARMRAGYKPY